MWEIIKKIILGILISGNAAFIFRLILEWNDFFKNKGKDNTKDYINYKEVKKWIIIVTISFSILLDFMFLFF